MMHWNSILNSRTWVRSESVFAAARQPSPALPNERLSQNIRVLRQPHEGQGRGVGVG